MYTNLCSGKKDDVQEDETVHAPQKMVCNGRSVTLTIRISICATTWAVLMDALGPTKTVDNVNDMYHRRKKCKPRFLHYIYIEL